MTSASLSIEWCGDRGMAAPLAALMVRNLDPSYISHSEMMEGRALDRERWTGALESQLEAEFRGVLESEAGAPGADRLAVAYRGSQPVALAVVEGPSGASPSFAVIADLIVDLPERGSGTGRRLMAWIEKELLRLGVRRLFLESGVRNERAHRFFKDSGFETCSVVMMKEIGARVRS